MISALLIVNQKGEIVISRFYRDDVSRTAAAQFRQSVIAMKATGSTPPVKLVESNSFLFHRFNNLFFVAVTRSNANAALVFQFIYQQIRIFQAYFGNDFDEASLRNNFTLVFELLDETLDFGYPQNLSIDVLQLYINLGSVRAGAEEKPVAELTKQITGAKIDWRPEGVRHRKNEVFIDVLESVNLLMSHTGAVLRNDVTGQVMMRTCLTGMPECKFGLNDKLIMDREAGNRRSSPGVEIDDCTFHRCVKLGKFDADRTITFIPPDGEFELMRYRITDNVNLPFRLIPAVQEEGATRVTMSVKAIANFSHKLFATNVVIKIPTPPNTARARINASHGRARYEPEQRAIVWKVKRFGGGAEYMLSAEIELMQSTRERAWSRPPIAVEFQVPMFTASGLHVRFLKVYERKSNYSTTKWVRYITRGGSYQVPMFTASGLHVRFLKVYERKSNYSTTKWVRYITRGGSYQVRL